MSSHRRSKDKENYHKRWIEKKIRDIILQANKKEKVYYVFKNVLSSRQVSIAVDNIPRSCMYHLEQGRKWAQQGNVHLQVFLRSQNIHFQKKNEEDKEDEEEIRQKIKLPKFYLEIARILGLEKPNLCEMDKCIRHDEDLEVSIHDFLQPIVL